LGVGSENSQFARLVGWPVCPAKKVSRKQKNENPIFEQMIGILFLPE
jgi:hypothetical protein